MFTLVNGSYVIHYGAHSVCSGTGRGKRSLTVCVQVVNRINSKDIWFTVSGSRLSQPLTSTNPVGLHKARTGFLGHGYRIMATTTVAYPTSRGNVTHSATVYSAAAAP